MGGDVFGVFMVSFFCIVDSGQCFGHPAVLFTAEQQAAVPVRGCLFVFLHPLGVGERLSVC